MRLGWFKETSTKIHSGCKRLRLQEALSARSLKNTFLQQVDDTQTNFLGRVSNHTHHVPSCPPVGGPRRLEGTERLGVLKNPLKRVHAFQIEL